MKSKKWLGMVMICLAGTGVSAQVITGRVESKNTYMEIGRASCRERV